MIDFEKGSITYKRAWTGTTTNRTYTFKVPGMAEAGGDDVAEVYFYHKEEQYEERIPSCDFGVLFGTSGNTDRLFLAGNPEFPNVDFYSAMDDYTYFEDMNTVSMGSDGYAVLGYARLADNTLAIFKEKSQSEASIF